MIYCYLLTIFDINYLKILITTIFIKLSIATFRSGLNISYQNLRRFRSIIRKKENLGLKPHGGRGTVSRRLKPSVKIGAATLVLTPTEAYGNTWSGNCLQILPVIPKVPWNTFFCYRQLQRLCENQAVNNLTNC